jgi:AMMECR1 domain-containing protein
VDWDKNEVISTLSSLPFHPNSLLQCASINFKASVSINDIKEWNYEEKILRGCIGVRFDIALFLVFVL